jgi:hypothetical protein
MNHNKNMQFKEKKIILERELSELDKFTIEFINILKKHTKYVLISGYVSILLGRSRGSEDVDVLIHRLNKKELEKLESDLKAHNFYCLNTKNINEVLNESLAVRFAKNNTVIPNMEMKFIKNKVEELALKESIKVKINKQSLIISNLELQIAIKEQLLKSPKDLEDARHLRNITNINKNKLKYYEELINETY